MASIQDNVDLQARNTLAAPAVAAHFALLEDPAELEDLLVEARSEGWPITVLGEGSNVVLGREIPGLTLLQHSSGIELVSETAASARVRVAAGENWHRLVMWCLERGYFGLENLALIPGTVGAAPIQNIGAYGVEIGDFIDSVACRELPSGRELVLSREDCEFDYRDSVFKRRLRDRVLIESVTLKLPRKAKPCTDYPSLAGWLEEHGVTAPDPAKVFEAVVAIRSSRLPNPAEVPNAGSFFKNPRLSNRALQRLLDKHPDAPHYRDDRGGFKLPAAWLIEQCGFKQRMDPVRVHPDHALVIINPEGRPATEIAGLAAEIAATVLDRFGILLEQEPRAYCLSTDAHG